MSTPRVEVKPIEQGAQPDPNNVNKHTQKGGGLLENSLRKRGAFRSIASAGKNVETPVVMAGNYTLEKAIDAGFTEIVNVHVTGNQIVNVVRDDLDPNSPEAIALGIEDNEIGKQSYAPDIDMLAALAAGDNAVLAALKQEDKIFNSILDGMGLKTAEPVNAEPQIDRAAELAEKWQTASGQLWKLGDHRLLIGDCTVRENVERLMGGERADMTFIDPPYGVDYEGGAQNEKKREKLEGDESGDLYLPLLSLCKEFSNKHSPMYVWFADRCGKPVYDAVEAIGYKVRAMIIWNKLDAHYGAFMAQYMQKHEPCLYIVDGNASWVGASNEVTVWDLKQPSKNEFHPTQKPVELATRAIGNHEAQIVIDLCCGSGTSIMACESLKRQCRAGEKSIKYGAVILERFYTATGITPELVE